MAAINDDILAHFAKIGGGISIRRCPRTGGVEVTASADDPTARVPAVGSRIVPRIHRESGPAIALAIEEVIWEACGKPQT